MKESGPEVVARALRLHYPGQHGCTRFCGADLDIQPGTVTALVGPNGIGKTTIMHAILGLIPVRSGRLTVGGMPARRYRRRFGVGYLPQHPVAPAGWTIGEWIATSARLRGATRRHAREQTGALLSALGLEDRRADRLERLSWGTTRRAALAFALVGEPSLVGLDEPMAGLDPDARLRTSLLVRRLRTTDATVLISMHDLVSARTLADRAILLRRDHAATRLDVRELLHPDVRDPV